MSGVPGTEYGFETETPLVTLVDSVPPLAHCWVATHLSEVPANGPGPIHAQTSYRVRLGQCLFNLGVGTSNIFL